MFRSVLVARTSILLLICLAACGGESPAPAPAISFTAVPPAAAGGAERTAGVEGRVTGAVPGQRIVLYAKAGVWWVQPLTAEPFTAIQADGRWKSTIHLGTDYAALLVDPGYRPPDTAESLPQPGSGVVAVAVVKGAGGVPPPAKKRLSFSGYEWDVRETPSDRGGANDYHPDNAWVDAEGLLHLRLTQREGRWSSAEVILTRALGYGTYSFTVRDISQMDPAAAFGMFTWDDEDAQQNHREMDIEISQWGDRTIPNGQYVLQPYYVPANVARFSAPAGPLTHTLRWEPGRAAFRTVRGAGATNGPPVGRHEFTSGVPTQRSERVRMNVYYFRYSPQPPAGTVEVVVERFQYVP